VDDKLRTVLWQWAGEAITIAEEEALRDLLKKIKGGHLAELETLLTNDEIKALTTRILRLIEGKSFPEPNPEWPHIPWPPF
jgi:hypothetical protein